MTRVDAVLWDMDGTLLDSEKLWDIAVRELAGELGREMTDEIRHALIGASGPNALRIMFEGLALDPTPEAIADAGHWLEARVTELFHGPIPWRPGAQDALDIVRSAGIPMALVTNTKRSLTEYALNTLSRDYFSATVCGDEVSHGKPAPDIYLRAAELLEVSPDRCAAIEDSPTGVLAAETAGCLVLCVPCEIPVPAGPGRTFRESLLGLAITDLHRLASHSSKRQGS
ncbi:HAD family hydrolase [Nocardia huaxiensis]|nr:HAD family phosphatase [Nocardia huaxiensis]